jgi:hypothetical protein
VSININSYVCLGNNSACERQTKPSPHDILLGLNYDSDTTIKGNGQIYYKHLDSNSDDFKSTKIYVNLFDLDFEPTNIFMITYDNVLPREWNSTSGALFQMFLATSDFNRKSFVLFKFISCPSYLPLKASTGLNHRNKWGILQDSKIFDGKQCTGSNVNQKGAWVSDVNSKGK